MASSRNKAPASGPASTGHYFSAWKIILPVIIGLAVVALMFYHDARKEDLADVWRSIRFTPWAVFCIFLAFCCMFGRDFGLSWRFRELTDKQLRWSQAYKVDLLCEFTSCVTPSAVGGSSLGMVFLNTQGIEFGRATTLMLTTLFLDELFFVVFCPIVVFVTPAGEIFASGGEGFSHGIEITFWLVYSFLALYTFVLFTGIIWKPLWIRKVISVIFRWRILRRWSDKADALGENMVATSRELRTKSASFWIKVFGATSLSWTSRYLVVNALFLAFLPHVDQWIVLARQFVIWVVLMVSPTPGGSGLSEWIFSEYYGDLVPSAGLVLILAIFWRLISYYVYLLIGAVILPSWLGKAYTKLRGKSSGKAASKETDHEQE